MLTYGGRSRFPSIRWRALEELILSSSFSLWLRSCISWIWNKVSSSRS